MDKEQLREYCLSFPGSTEDTKWQKDLCFCVGGKMFCVTGVDDPEGLQYSFKCTPERFADLTERVGIIPAPYAARFHWVAIESRDALTETESRQFIAESYRLVFQRLPRRVQTAIAE